MNYYIIFISLSYALAEPPTQTTSPTTTTPVTTPAIPKEGAPPPVSRNPFVDAPYGRVKKEDLSGAAGVDSALKGLKVKGILMGRDYPVALLGRRMVKTGDVIDGLTVTEITRTGVTLSYGDRMFQLSIE
ncbi:MAG: hypothetical protein HZA12_05615 [Nitrospirae bacterium]|nr:hypothetical protein [Nitrospirota bacterium]